MRTVDVSAEFGVKPNCEQTWAKRSGFFRMRSRRGSGWVGSVLCWTLDGIDDDDLYWPFGIDQF